MIQVASFSQTHAVAIMFRHGAKNSGDAQTAVEPRRIARWSATVHLSRPPGPLSLGASIAPQTRLVEGMADPSEFDIPTTAVDMGIAAVGLITGGGRARLACLVQSNLRRQKTNNQQGSGLRLSYKELYPGLCRVCEGRYRPDRYGGQW